MDHITPGYLSKKGGQWRSIRLLDVAILLWHVHRGAHDEQVGFEDCLETINSLTKRLNKAILVDPAILESALWSANLMNEQGKYWHPKDVSFDDFVRQLLGSDKFNRDYNVIEKKGSDE